mgnify:CR=1 FL=1
MFKKNNVYRWNGKKYVCLFVDNSYSCVVPIQPSRKHSGYKLLLSKVALYPPSFNMMQYEVEKIGIIKDGNYRPIKNN